MSVYRAVTDVSATAAFPATPQVVIPIQPIEIAILNESSANDAYASLNGINDHAHLAPGAGITFKQKCNQVWLRYGSLAAGPTNVAVIAES